MNKEKLMTVLLEPRVTEKTTMVGEKYNQYAFKVAKHSNKTEIKQAVELMFEGAKVESVKVVNVKGKQKVFSRRSGKRADWKKAYVKLQAGFDIDFIGA